MVSANILNKLKICSQMSSMLSKHAAVIIHKGVDVAYGFNHFDSRGLSRHAEQDVIMSYLQHIKKCSIPKLFFDKIHSNNKLCKKFVIHLKKIKIIVIRFSTIKDKFILSAPCVKCKNILLDLGIDKITFSNEVGEFVFSKIENVKNHYSRLDRSKLRKK